MSKTTAPVKVGYELENDLYAVTCEQHGYREVFDSVHRAEQDARNHEAEFSHWVPSAAPVGMWIVQVVSAGDDWLSLVQPEGTTPESALTVGEYYANKGYTTRLLVSYNGGKTARVFKTYQD